MEGNSFSGAGIRSLWGSIHAPTWGAKTIDIFNFDIPKKDIRQVRRRADIHNISLRFIKFPETYLAGF